MPLGSMEANVSIPPSVKDTGSPLSHLSGMVDSKAAVEQDSHPQVQPVSAAVMKWAARFYCLLALMRFGVCHVELFHHIGVPVEPKGPIRGSRSEPGVEATQLFLPYGFTVESITYRVELGCIGKSIRT
ncbi:hypothetical protein Q9966_012801 [Columba livia]|nr:hypothetical protein Q9966_012801 [Columba livia]